MLLKTNIDLPEYPWKIGYKSKLFFAGSCFADEIGQKFLDNKFHCLVNPLGIQFNPVSLSRALEYGFGTLNLSEQRLEHRDNRWHHFDFHGVFSGRKPEQTISALKKQIELTKTFLQDTDIAFITLGTAQVHKYKLTGQIVANNHKFPAHLFEGGMLSLEEVTEALTGLINGLKMWNPEIQIVFTVSPVRYLSNGMHQNQLSKATLLMAVDALMDLEHVSYFPAYEIFMDDLRDYRFYGEDLVHPAKSGVDYVWELLTKATLDHETTGLLSQVQKLSQSFKHRPIYPDSPDYIAFLTKLKVDMEIISSGGFGIDFSFEIGELEKRMVAFG